MMRVVISPRAKRDLQEIWRFTAERWNPAQARAYVTRIDAVIARLASPTGAPTRCDWIRPGYARARSGSHSVFVRADGDVVIVVRVLHERMNFAHHLGDEPAPEG